MGLCVSAILLDYRQMAIVKFFPLNGILVMYIHLVKTLFFGAKIMKTNFVTELQILYTPK